MGNSNQGAGYDEAEDMWRVIVKYYGDLDVILSGIRGIAYTGLFKLKNRELQPVNFKPIQCPILEIRKMCQCKISL